MTSAHPHTRHYHAIVRAFFHTGITLAVVGFVLILTGLSEPVVGAALGFLGTMTAFFAGWCRTCETSCASD
jgi:hypothetical protein